MRIFWQSFIDATASAAYMARLSEYLNAIAEPGTTVDVFGISPPDRHFGRLAEFRCAAIAIDNGLEAAAHGYDAVVIGHFQDPGLYELKSSVKIPVIGTGEVCMHYAARLGRRLALVTLDDVFQVWHYEQADLYGLGSRVRHVVGMNCEPSDFSAAFAGDSEARQRMLAGFTACAEPLVRDGADVVVPAGVLPGLLVGGEYGFKVLHAPVINTAAVTLKSAEMDARLQKINGIEVSRGPFCSLANEHAVEDFRNFVANGRGAPLFPSGT
ncbi:aspartate/glutamate racemase family protein [Rhizobium sp. NTR19]|uniref:Aspartate/glutamate racemase family protein n=1 Tax=Neorhizobium turbinariae TaxID=2937795 RepID=A0ABT0IPI9_9HYPH|nr:aspartate/glutamate racemase family protein [Neorhizobium turbinariae]MCK8779778.1 aspartate/glutamate racemase family protein [Neorhizobium turbinariae]